MTKKIKETFIKHDNVCFLTLKGLINKLQFFFKLHTS